MQNYLKSHINLYLNKFYQKIQGLNPHLVSIYLRGVKAMVEYEDHIDLQNPYPERLLKKK